MTIMFSKILPLVTIIINRLVEMVKNKCIIIASILKVELNLPNDNNIFIFYLSHT